MAEWTILDIILATSLVANLVGVVDKIVAMSPPTTWIGKHDDMIWTVAKRVLRVAFPGKMR